jgi:hypothetical protein
LAQLNGTVSQISEENSGYILDLVFFSEFAPTKRLPQLIGDPINRNAQQLTREILGKTGEGVHSLRGR